MFIGKKLPAFAANFGTGSSGQDSQLVTVADLVAEALKNDKPHRFVIERTKGNILAQFKAHEMLFKAQAQKGVWSKAHVDEIEYLMDQSNMPAWCDVSQIMKFVSAFFEYTQISGVEAWKSSIKIGDDTVRYPVFGKK